MTSSNQTPPSPMTEFVGWALQEGAALTMLGLALIIGSMWAENEVQSAVAGGAVLVAGFVQHFLTGMPLMIVDMSDGNKPISKLPLCSDPDCECKK